MIYSKFYSICNNVVEDLNNIAGVYFKEDTLIVYRKQGSDLSLTGITEQTFANLVSHLGCVYEKQQVLNWPPLEEKKTSEEVGQEAKEPEVSQPIAESGECL